MAALFHVDPDSYLWATCPKHLSTKCQTCPKCFHGRFRCQYCYRTRGGTASTRRGRRRLRCACCGRFRRAGTISICERCDVRGFVALTLF